MWFTLAARAVARGAFVGSVTTIAGLKAAADSSGLVAVWVALIGAVATVLAVTLPILLRNRRNTVDDEQLALALVDKLAAAEKHSHRQQIRIDELKAQLAKAERREE